MIEKQVEGFEEITFSYLNDKTKKTFPEGREEQLKALPDDEMLDEYRRCRKDSAGDRYRPRFHYTAPNGILNDPNGLCFWKGKWHLFYQHILPVTENGKVNSWGTIYWGHLVSDDLVHWIDLPDAIYPNPEKECWSGAVCVEDEKVTAMYYGYRGHSGLYTASSYDPLLLNWTKCYPGPVIPGQSGNGKELPYKVYDPCIWKNDGMYYALSGSHIPHAGTGNWSRVFYLFRSKNAVDWEYLHPFTSEDTFEEAHDDGACPYFLPLGEKYLLFYFSHARSSRYLIGDYDKENDLFVPCSGGRITQSRCSGLFAGSAAPDPSGDGSARLIFCMPGGSLSLPYRISLPKENDMLEIAPCEELSSLRKEETRVRFGKTELPANRQIVLEGIGGSGIELEAEFDIQDNAVLEMKILRSPDDAEYTRITVYRHRGAWADWSNPFSVLSVDCSHSQLAIHDDNKLLAPPSPDLKEFRLYPDEKIRLHVFIDKSVVEVFCNDRVVISKTVYPVKDDSVGVAVSSLGADGSILSLDMWEMDAIDPTDLESL